MSFRVCSQLDGSEPYILTIATMSGIFEKGDIARPIGEDDELSASFARLRSPSGGSRAIENAWARANDALLLERARTRMRVGKEPFAPDEDASTTETTEIVKK